jgi:hypothetical protein
VRVKRHRTRDYLLQLLPVLCGFHIVCLSVEGKVLNSAVDTNIVYLALSLVSPCRVPLWLGPQDLAQPLERLPNSSVELASVATTSYFAARGIREWPK